MAAPEEVASLELRGPDSTARSRAARPAYARRVGTKAHGHPKGSRASIPLKRRKPRSHGDGSVYRQRAVFFPKGLGGRLYWFAILPFHGVIFNGMANRITATAAGLPDSGDERSPCGRGAQR